MKKMSIKFLLLIMGIMLITACGKKDSGEKTADAAKTGGPVTIEFMHSMVEQERLDQINLIIADFEKENPDIKIKQIPVDEDSYQTKVTTLGSSGKLPAIIEVSNNYAKVMAKNEFVDYESVDKVIADKKADSFYDGALRVLKTEDGKNYAGVPVSGWVQGVWYNKKMFAEKGLKEPKTWEDILAAAKAFNDPANKKYGIALATANGVMTEQVFSQFALSNGANVLDASGKASLDTPEMKEAIEYYKELSKYTMPGSNDVTQVKDAFLGGSAPMAIYSTYILPSAYKEGLTADLGYTVPEKKQGAAFGVIIALTITNGLDENQKVAAQKFVAFMLKDQSNAKWVLMSPGGLQPVIKSVAASPEYTSNEVVKTFAAFSEDLTSSFNNLQMFGVVGDKNFVVMGDITNAGVIGKMMNEIVVNNAGIPDSMKKAHQEIAEIAK